MADSVNRDSRHVLVLNQFALPMTQPGGTRHAELFSRLTGWKYKIVAGDRNHYSQEQFSTDDPTFELVPVPSQQGGARERLIGWLRYSSAAFVQALRATDLDLVYGSSPQILAPLAGLAAARIRRVPFVLEVRDLWPESIVESGMLRRGSLVHKSLTGLEKLLVKGADEVIVVTRGWEDHFVKLGVRRLTVVSNGSVFKQRVPTDEVGQVVGPRPVVGGPTGVFAGAHGAANGLDIVLEAAEANPNVGFVFIGDGPKKKDAINAARERGLDNVLFLDPIPKDEFAPVLASYDFGIHCLADMDVLKLGMSPNKVFDYLASDVPIVSNSAAGLSWITEQGEVGVIRDGDLSGSIRKMAGATPEQKEQWAINRKRLMTGPYSRDESARLLGERLDAVIDARSGSSGAVIASSKGHRVAHVTTVHNATDNRILRKECQALADAGYETYLVAPGAAEKTVAPAVIGVDIPRISSRVKRMALGPLHAFRAIRLIKPDVVHVHDPELIPLAVAVRALTKAKAVYDAHEDLEAQVAGKPYVKGPLRPVVSKFAGAIERVADATLDGIVAATPAIAKKYKNSNKFLVRNLPWLQDFPKKEAVAMEGDGKLTVGYVGGITSIRGFYEMIEATRDHRLVLAGPVEEALKGQLDDLPEHVEYLGNRPAEEVPHLVAQFDVGLVLFADLPNHRESRPTKLFEYMAAGIPFIASDFSSWLDLVGSEDVGFFVSPSDVNQIRAAIDKVSSNREGAKSMGSAGRDLFEERFSFDADVPVLTGAYAALLGEPQSLRA